MAGRQAKLLTENTLRKALKAISRRRNADRDRVILLLSARAGLRACEIAALEWSMVAAPNGRVGSVMSVEDRIAKRRSGRKIPIHRELKDGLRNLAKHGSSGPVVRSARGGAFKPNSLVNWFVSLFAEINAPGCSSHSGRRAFITNAARNAHKSGATLRDVQILAGHRSIEVTQGYIDGDSDAQRRLVASL